MSRLFSPSAPSVGLEAWGLGPSGSECGMWSLEGSSSGERTGLEGKQAALAGGRGGRRGPGALSVPLPVKLEAVDLPSFDSGSPGSSSFSASRWVCGRPWSPGRGGG